jgi:hypothetical protein
MCGIACGAAALIMGGYQDGRLDAALLLWLVAV